MATISLESVSPGIVTLRIDGPIKRGDAKEFAAIADRAVRNQVHTEGPVFVTVAIDSPGGDYEEGIDLGKLFWKNGYRTLVRSGSRCYSAAATAFLGGSFLGASGGWGPDRVVELGGNVGFHSFYVSSPETALLAEGIEQGKQLTILLTSYAIALRVDIKFLVESLRKGPSELLLVKTVDQFRKLEIQLMGARRTTVLTAEGAVHAANYATQWRRPLSVSTSAKQSTAIVRAIDATEFRKDMLRRLIDPSGTKGLAARIIKRALLALGAQIESAIPYDIKVLVLGRRHSAIGKERVFYVSGFDYGGGFYVTDCFVIPHNEGTDRLTLSVVTVDTGNSLKVFQFNRHGDFLYEVHHPDSEPVRCP